MGIASEGVGEEMNLLDLREEEKCKVALFTAEMVLESVEEQDLDYDYAKNAIKLCWDWMENKKISKIEICEKISSNDKCLADIVLDIEDVEIANKYASIMICVSYVAWQAYNYDEDYNYPQDLECIDDEYFEELIVQLIEEEFMTGDEYQKILAYAKLS